jgi:hypothetical protein
MVLHEIHNMSLGKWLGELQRHVSSMEVFRGASKQQLKPLLQKQRTFGPAMGIKHTFQHQCFMRRQSLLKARVATHEVAAL